jgi:dihydrofolate reductase
MKFSIIVAKTINNVIGQNGGIPWHLTKDLKYFREITFSNTKNNVVIMGRKTWDSLKKPLLGRIHIVLSNNPDFSIDNKVGYVSNSFESALELIKECVPNLGDIFVIGGGVLYNNAIKHKDCDKIYCTEILHYYIDKENVTYFPNINKDCYVLSVTTPIIDENDMSFRFNVYSRCP